MTDHGDHVHQNPETGEVAEIPRPKSQIEFFLDARGQKRWRVQLAGNAEIIGSASEGYHNLTEAGENLAQLVQEVVKEALVGSGVSLDSESVQSLFSDIRDHVMAVAAQGIPQDEQDRFVASLKAPLTGTPTDVR